MFQVLYCHICLCLDLFHILFMHHFQLIPSCSLLPFWFAKCLYSDRPVTFRMFRFPPGWWPKSAEFRLLSCGRFPSSRWLGLAKARLLSCYRSPPSRWPGSAKARLLSFSLLVLFSSKVKDICHNLICEEINWTGPNVHLLFIILHHFELGKHK